MIYQSQTLPSFASVIAKYAAKILAALPGPVGMSNNGEKTPLSEPFGPSERSLVMRNAAVSVSVYF
jgi:hypothetical protein